MEGFDSHSAGVMLLGVGGLLSILLTYNKIKRMFQDELDDKLEDAIDLAKADAKARADMLQLEIEKAEEQIEGLRKSIEKDMLNARDNYKSEISDLKETMSDLRIEIRQQYSQLMGLLEKVIGKN